MKRFENAQIGDLVYSDTFGDCSIVTKSETNIGVLPVNSYEFHTENMRVFNLDGFYIGLNCLINTKPSLFYRKGDERYLTERPEPEIDWLNVKPGTCFSVIASDGSCFNDQRIFRFFAEGKPWFSSLVDSDTVITANSEKYTFKLTKIVKGLT